MYQEVFNEHADILKALANPRRLEIVQLLRDQELPVSQIQAMLDLPQANISQHLCILKGAGILNSRKSKKNIYYAVADQRFVQALDYFRAVLIERFKDQPLASEFVAKMSDLVPLVHDPVCGMRLSPTTAGFAHKHQNHFYYFCASGCHKVFIKEPAKYV